MPESLSEPPPELSLRAGESARFQRRGAGAAGYDWRWTIEGDASAVTVAVDPSTPAPRPSPSSEGLRVGSVGLVLSLHGVRQGVARLTLELARPAKSRLPPLASFITTVTVSPQGDLTAPEAARR